MRTPKWDIENKEGEGLSGTFGNPRYTDPRVFALNSTIANTNIVWHGSKLLALEEAHAPFSLDPASLMPVRPKDEIRDLRRQALSVPSPPIRKMDPKTGEMVFFGYSAKGRFTKEVSVQSVTADGKITRAEILDGPYPSMIHDFAVTTNWIVLPIFPLTSSMERAMGGLPPFAWEPDKGSHIAFIPRGGYSRRREVGQRTALLRLPSDEPFRDGRRQGRGRRHEIRRGAALPLPDGSPVHQGDARGAGCSRWTFDLSGHANTFKEEQLDDRAGEFPRFDERFDHERLPPRLDRVGQCRRSRRPTQRGHHPLRPADRP